MIDIHTHILPAIDDGAENLQDTIEMLKEEEQNGITKVAATPHYICGRYENEYKYISNLVESIKTEAVKNGIKINVFPGQEVLADKYTVKLYKQKIIRGINDTKYILIELPMNYLNYNFLDIIYELRLLGLKPIIAHPERYNFIIEDIIKINNFIDEDCLFQINAGSIYGVFGKRVKKTAQILIKHGICNFIASDIHSRRRVSHINYALSFVDKIDKNLENYIKNNGQRVLSNKDIPQRLCKISSKKTIFDFLRK